MDARIMYCNNCGRKGHVFKSCEDPIISCGIILVNRPSLPALSSDISILMVRRKDSMAYTEFLRGKYNPDDLTYIKTLLSNMTQSEHGLLCSMTFDELWTHHWGVGRDRHSHEFEVSKKKFISIDLKDMVEGIQGYSESEWGFPKGRRVHRETDMDCAIREFSEETGYISQHLKNIDNILPFEEIFMGSNYKSYKHKYFLMYMNYEDTLVSDSFEKTEVSKIEWKSYEDCMNSIRDYNLEKKKIITNINKCLSRYLICQSFNE
jgi:8-oxo-dGTP pyrophosphatase MutT (NUDIX family)